jgi:phage-related protein
MVQVGREPSDWKPLPVVGSGAAEIRVGDETGAWRVIYVARFAEAVYVLHAFQKKSRKTSQDDIRLPQRYRDEGKQKRINDGLAITKSSGNVFLT